MLLPQLAELFMVKMLCACVCVWMLTRVKSIVTKRCTEKLVILRAQIYWWTQMAHQKLGQSDLHYQSNRSPKEVGANTHFQAGSQPMWCRMLTVCINMMCAAEKKGKTLRQVLHPITLNSAITCD